MGHICLCLGSTAIGVPYGPHLPVYGFRSNRVPYGAHLPVFGLSNNRIPYGSHLPVFGPSSNRVPYGAHLPVFGPSSSRGSYMGHICMCSAACVVKRTLGNGAVVFWRNIQFTKPEKEIKND